MNKTTNKTKKQPNSNKTNSSDKLIRLNKYISNAGVCSRRQADNIISNGEIKVNGKIITELGLMVDLKDTVEYHGKKLNPEKKQYVLLNKPKNFVTTLKDPNAEKTVIDLVKHACKERIYPVGRLDKMTLGVLLLTNDGDLAKKLTHPSSNKKKIYHVFLDRPFKEEHMKKIHAGIELEDGYIKVDGASFLNKTNTEIGVEIHSGRNRIVRRIFGHFNYKVKKLDRTYFCGLTKKTLNRGEWRHLTDKEVGLLKAGVLK
jgi:23S rRNA pseudouridine2605 synthase